MCILWSVASTKGLHQPNHLASLFKASLDKRNINKVRKERVACDKEMASGHQYLQGPFGKQKKEMFQLTSVGYIPSADMYEVDKEKLEYPAYFVPWINGDFRFREDVGDVLLGEMVKLARDLLRSSAN